MRRDGVIRLSSGPAGSWRLSEMMAASWIARLSLRLIQEQAGCNCPA
jgi:hypothetical protein